MASLDLDIYKRLSVTYVILVRELATLRITIYISAACVQHSMALLMHLKRATGDEAPFQSTFSRNWGEIKELCKQAQQSEQVVFKPNLWNLTTSSYALSIGATSIKFVQ